MSPKQDTVALNLRDMPLNLVARLKAAAALDSKPMKQYLTELIEEHLAALERKGLLPKSR